MTGNGSENMQHGQLDREWVELIACARAKGLTPDEVRRVLSIIGEERSSIIQESAV
ncbi:anti-repressor SinI family protein [Paenibacillus sp. CAU 1782]